MSSDKIFYAIVGFFTVAMFVGIVFFASSNNTSSTGKTEENVYTPEQILGEDPHVFGDIETAKVVMVEFSDFQCPACKNFSSSVVTRIKEDYPEDVAIVYRHLPLTTIHNYAFDAAVASEAARKQDKFWEYHDELFKNQGTTQNPLKEEDFIDIAAGLGLDTEQFKKDIDSKEVQDLARDDFNFALSIGLNSTPSVFINGKKVDLQTTDIFTYIDSLVTTSTPTAGEQQN